MPSSDNPVSRREFARRAALGAVAAPFLPLQPMAPGAQPKTVQAPANAPKLSPQSQAEAEARWKAILEQYTDRFTEAQKEDLKRLSFFVQPALDRVRSYAIDNGALPGPYLKPLVDRDKNSSATSASKPAGPGTAKH